VPVSTKGRKISSRMRLPRDARRAQLIDSASAVFVASGYHAAAMDEIAEHAGVSKPVLYQHFPSKLELYLAMLDQNIAEFLKIVHEALASTDDNKQRVSAAISVYFTYIDDPHSAFRLLFENDLTSSSAVRERLDGLTHACAEEIAVIIESDTGRSHDEAQLLAVGLVGQAQVSARYWLNSKQQIDRDTASHLLASLAWRGIAGFPRR
jgi:AcrR family transcriptional regulator